MLIGTSVSLQDVKEGDLVILETNSISKTTYGVETVEKVTKTQVHVKGLKYRRSNGCEITSNSYHRNYICGATKENLAVMGPRIQESQLERRKELLAYRLSSISWKDLDLDTLQTVYTTLKECLKQ